MQEQTSSRVYHKADDNRSITKAVPLSALQLQEHPEFPHVNWELTPTKKGKIATAKDRGGPINIAYEVHGNGPAHIVVSHFPSIISSSLVLHTFFDFAVKAVWDDLRFKIVGS